MQFRNLTVALFLIYATGLSLQNASAEEVQLGTVPTAWRLQNYVYPNGEPVATWFTGSSCTNGQLIFDTGVSQAVVDRYWSLIMSAKIAQQPVVVYYENVGGNCFIRSFLLCEQ